MSPILVRPVREQLEHDRVIRQLQKDLSRRKMDVSINPGAEQNVPVGSGARKEFPDVVLFSPDKSRKLLGIIEVETGESVNHLEVMAQWAHYARLKAPVYLYVPMASVDVARRLAADHKIQLAEVHTYHQIGDLVRFATAYRSGTGPKLPDDPLPPDPAQRAKPAPPAPPPPVVKKAPPTAAPVAVKKAPPTPAPVAVKKAAPAPAPVVVKKAAPAPAPVAKPAKAVPIPVAKPDKNGKAAAKPGKAAPAPIKKVAPPPKKVVAAKTKAVPKKVAKPATAKKAAPKKAAGKRK